MDLSEREKIVLGAIVQNFINTATPVGSSLIAKKTHLNMSPATIRHIMAELERKGYIFQPHPSAGRVPTTHGYRVYVDSLMQRPRLSSLEKEKIRTTLQITARELDDMLKEATRVLAHLSRQLGVVVSPRVEEGIFEKMEIVSLSSERVLVVLSIKSGLVRTITLELETQISQTQLELMTQILNERLSGMRLRDVRANFSKIIRDIRSDEKELLRVFLKNADRIFDFEENLEVVIVGTQYILQQPEFSNLEKFSPVVELLENRDVVIHLLEEEPQSTSLSIKIGEEIPEQRMQECSIISARYQIGRIAGSLGVIGPKRMNYSKLIALVDYTARSISEVYSYN